MLVLNVCLEITSHLSGTHTNTCYGTHLQVLACIQRPIAHCNAAVFIQGDQKLSVHPMISVQKTRKNILNSFDHLPG
jgi:hypothetical protein